MKWLPFGFLLIFCGFTFSAEVKVPAEIFFPSAKEVRRFQNAFVGAVQALQIKNYTKAIRLLQLAKPNEPLAQLYVTSLLYEAYIGLAKFDKADSVLAEKCKTVSSSSWQAFLWKKRALIFSQTTPSDSNKLEFYEQAIFNPIPANVKFEFIQAWLNLKSYRGNFQGFEKPLHTLVELSYSDKRADTLYKMLNACNPICQSSWEVQNLLLAWEEKLGYFSAGISRCEALLACLPNPEEKRKLQLNVIRLYLKDKQYVNVISVGQKYSRLYGEHAEVWLQMAKAQDKNGEEKKAQQTYDTFLEKFPQHEKSSEIYWLRAFDAEGKGDYTKAIELYFRQLVPTNKNKRAEWANFRIGWNYAKQQNDSVALTFFRNVRAQKNLAATSAGIFWEAQMRQRLGDTAGVYEDYNILADQFPYQFYGCIARDTLNAHQKKKIINDSLLAIWAPASSRPDSLKAWMQNNLSDFKELTPNNFASNYLDIGKLLQLHLDTLAITTFKSFPDSEKNNPWLLLNYSRIFLNYKLYPESYKIGLLLWNKISEEQIAKTPLAIAKLIYPQAYSEEVRQNAMQSNLDPYFIFALMRQESGFDPNIKSAVGATGLMQIMPATGKRIAQKAHIPKFASDDLQLAAINIRLGTVYLHELMQIYKGSLPFILANYNAGPEPAKRWQSQLGKKPLEQYVEDISYWETRDYIKKVMANYWIYKKLYTSVEANKNVALTP